MFTGSLLKRIEVQYLHGPLEGTDQQVLLVALAIRKTARQGGNLAFPRWCLKARYAAMSLN